MGQAYGIVTPAACSADGQVGIENAGCEGKRQEGVHLLQLSGEKAAKARRMLDFMSLGGSLLILMQFCRMLSGTILACSKHCPVRAC